MSDTPRCDAVGFEVWTREFGNVEVMPLDDGQKLERDLTAVTRERDALRLSDKPPHECFESGGGGELQCDRYKRERDLAIKAIGDTARMLAMAEPALRAENERLRALLRGTNAIRCRVYRGTITRPDRCEACGEPAHTYGHHSDYSKPLDVKWVCRACHAKIHTGRENEIIKREEEGRG